MTLSEGEKKYILDSVNDDCRIDGRQRNNYRLMQVETDVIDHANGSARLRIGETEVLVCVKAELETPKPETPDRGAIQFFIDCSANASPQFAGRGGNELASDIQSCLDRAFSSPSVLDYTALCVERGHFSWTLFVDILILQCGGNLYDAVSLGVKAALYNTVIAKVAVKFLADNKPEVEVSSDPSKGFKLDVTNVPCFMTFLRIGNHCVLDPSLEEESCGQGSLVVGITVQGIVTHVRKVGPGSFHPTSMEDALNTANAIGPLIHMQLLSKLKEETADKRGFLR
ncbi:unnamed protein product [Darwinula stevensoni]|uniref:Ribosomal RNA-processing protein 42 n=1 Tax=Darwinula stevensoni TaxID=69355 RepID=A0A7R8X395_9CRUS|nr:unnamed protein product [Darwinula stevensoni]CAG0884128.1 unnamed protein product [Darwinula stevensoni]